MIRSNRWFPNTCDCVVDFEWDDEVPDTEREHTPVRIEVCEVHAPIAAASPHDLGAVFAAIVETNRVAQQG